MSAFTTRSCLRIWTNQKPRIVPDSLAVSAWRPRQLELHDRFVCKHPREVDNGFIGILPQCALPDHEDPPTPVQQRQPVAAVTLDIRLKFCQPEFPPVGRRRGVATAFMPVPVAAMNENDRGMAFQDEIRASGQVSNMQSEAETLPMQAASDKALRPGMLLSHRCHHSGADFRSYGIDH